MKIKVCFKNTMTVIINDIDRPKVILKLEIFNPWMYVKGSNPCSFIAVLHRLLPFISLDYQTLLQHD